MHNSFLFLTPRWLLALYGCVAWGLTILASVVFDNSYATFGVFFLFGVIGGGGLAFLMVRKTPETPGRQAFFYGIIPIGAVLALGLAAGYFGFGSGRMDLLQPIQLIASLNLIVASFGFFYAGAYVGGRLAFNLRQNVA